MRTLVPISTLLAAVVLTTSCSSLQMPERQIVMGPGCNAQQLPFTGSLAGKRTAVIDALGPSGGRLHQRPDRSASRPPGPNPTYRLIPTCKNYQFTMGDLVDGRFVGLIVVTNDASKRFSALETDYVAWWVYGTLNSSGQIVLRSEFASLRADTDAEFIRRGTFNRCDKPGDWTEEEAGWHGNTCDDHSTTMTRAMSGDNPWFGCTRGCCYAVADES